MRPTLRDFLELRYTIVRRTPPGKPKKPRWPETRLMRSRAVHNELFIMGHPATPEEVARQFTCVRPSKVKDTLDALVISRKAVQYGRRYMARHESRTVNRRPRI